MLFRPTVVVGFLLIECMAFAQQTKEHQWNVISGFEVNYTGNNTFLRIQHIGKKNHLLEAGVSYNVSDGFADRTVLGIDLGYGYRLLTKEKWSLFTGVDYRLQRPIKILNIQTLTYTNTLNYFLLPQVMASVRLGYGVATARARSAGVFTQTNSPTGSLMLSCGYLF